MSEKKLLPLSDLTLGDADSFLESILRQTHEADETGGKLSHTSKENDVTNEDSGDKTGHDVMTEIMSKYDVVSKVDESGTDDKVVLSSIMTATCVVLTAASNVVPTKAPEMTMKRVASALEKIDGKKKSLLMLTAPLNMAIEYYKAVMHAVMEGNFLGAFEKLDHEHLIQQAKQAFQYANNNEDISLETFRYRWWSI